MTTQRARVAVVGASGYAGGEAVRLVAGHPQLELGVLGAGSRAGRRLAEVHPALAALGDLTLIDAGAGELADAEVVLLALPHGQSAALAVDLDPAQVVVDLGADHRLGDASAWQTYYGGAHAGTWPYGLPELDGGRDHLAGATRIANPGCYPTAVALGLAPLLAAGLVEPSDVVVVAASGTSGAGRTTADSLMASEIMGAMSAYKAGGRHQHTPEMEQALTRAAGEPVVVSFTPTLAPMPRGILSTCTARLSPGATEDDLRQVTHDAYAAEPFVHLLPDGAGPTTGAVLGSNACHLQVAADQHSGRAIVVSAIDNLVKGAAGQAIQNVNLALGLDETLGLPLWGVAP